MAVIRMIEEDEASPEVREIYEDIKATLGIQFVPHMYRVMAVSPHYLEANWSRIKQPFSLWNGALRVHVVDRKAAKWTRST